MKDIINKINEAQSTSKSFLVLHCCNNDGVTKDYYFWTSLPEEDTKIINYKHLANNLKETLQKKFPKIWKEVEEILEYVDSRNSEARVWTENFAPSKIKNL